MRFAAKKIPGYHTASDIVQFARDAGLTGTTQETATPAVSVPMTEGTPWGKPILGTDYDPQQGWRPTGPPAPTPAEAQPSVPRVLFERGPQPISGESALGEILTRTDNATLLRIAKSRGISVTKESQLKPGVADSMLVRKIIADFSPEELQEIGSKYMEATRFQHQFGDITPEAWHSLSLEYYFPSVKIPAAMAKRSAASIAANAAGSDLTGILQKSLARAKTRK
jgi:hypothetical protein